MPKFQIEIEEILQRVEEVEAKDLEEALDIIEEKYDSQEIILDSEDFKGHEIREYRNKVKEEDLMKDTIIEINFGEGMILEGDKKLALIKRLGDEIAPYVVVSNIRPNKEYGTYFEWDKNPLYFSDLIAAVQEYEIRANKHTCSNDLIYSELGEFTLGSHNITRFDNVDEIFNFLIDEDINKEELIEMLSEEAKRDVVYRYADVVIEEDGKYYYGDDFYFFEEEINEKTRKLDKILNELNIKNVKPYDVIELLEQNEVESINKNLEENITTAIKTAGYDKSIDDFINYINQELYKEEQEETEENEI